ncbi:MAG: hypothetical protein NC453_28360 [Muribaculum sp.]|nr:hypothetical protein [Muribaculum sp.]
MAILSLILPSTLFAQTTSDIEMIYVQGGTFLMGYDDNDEAAERIEKPKHERSAADNLFQLMKCETACQQQSVHSACVTLIS